MGKNKTKDKTMSPSHPIVVEERKRRRRRGGRRREERRIGHHPRENGKNIRERMKR
jgi:hypothetical protein